MMSLRRWTRAHSPRSHQLESMGPSTPPVLESLVDLELLVEDPSPRDGSKANAASISLLLEWDGRRVLLTGDAIASELIGGLALIDGGARVPLDLVKLPHHGSRQNVSSGLIEAVDCPPWVFSSDGTTSDTRTRSRWAASSGTPEDSRAWPSTCPAPSTGGGRTRTGLIYLDTTWHTADVDEGITSLSTRRTELGVAGSTEQNSARLALREAPAYTDTSECLSHASAAARVPR